MKNSNRHYKKFIYSLCACFVLWTLGAYAFTPPPDVDHALPRYTPAYRLDCEPGDSGNDTPGKGVRKAVDYNDKTVELFKVGEAEDGNDVPTWAEMAADTYFMIFIDVSDSMNSSDIDAINAAAELFTQHLAGEVYEEDLDQAAEHVIVTEVTSERYLQHMAAWNLDDPNASRYVNICLLNEADQDYYTENSILYPSEKFMADLNGNQDCGGFIYGLRNELNQRTFSLGKVFNVGGRQGNNIGGFYPAFATHLYCAFNNVGDYADTNLGDLGISYENIERGLAPEQYAQFFIDALDYSAAYVSDHPPGECPTPEIQQNEKRIGFLI